MIRRAFWAAALLAAAIGCEERGHAPYGSGLGGGFAGGGGFEEENESQAENGDTGSEPAEPADTAHDSAPLASQCALAGGYCPINPYAGCATGHFPTQSLPGCQWSWCCSPAPIGLDHCDTFGGICVAGPCPSHYRPTGLWCGALDLQCCNLFPPDTDPGY